MNIKETIVIEFDKKEADTLNQASAILTGLFEEMNKRDAENINDNDGFGFRREYVVYAKEIMEFLNSSEQFTFD